MQLNQTHDRANRLSFKGALQHKVEAALTAPAPEAETPNQVLLLPSNFQELSETDLHFTLMQNKELKHSRETANMATEIVFGKRLHPKTVQFRTVELANPAVLPQFEKRQAKRSPAKKILADDSTTVRMQAEKAKEAEFKAYIETLSNRTRTDQVTLPAIHSVVLRVPKNYNDFSEAELFHVLMNTTELEHSRQTAYLAMDILSGKVSKPSNVTLQSVVLEKIVPSTPAPVKAKETIPAFVINAERDKREQFKAKLADKASVVSIIQPAYSPKSIELALPSHYEELSEAGLFYTLTHNPELQHSHDSATLAVDIVFKKIPQPESVKLHTIDLVTPEAGAITASAKVADPLDGFIPEREQSKRAELKQYLAEQTERILASGVADEELAPIVLKVPKNYKELSQDELLYVLINSTELAHNRASAYRTMDMLSGGVSKPANVTLQAVVLTKPVADLIVKLTPVKKIETAIHPAIKANEDAKYEAYLARQAETPTPVVEKELVLKVPANFKDMSGAELLTAITSNTNYGHTQDTAYLTLDIVSGRLSRPENVRLEAKTLAQAASNEKTVVLSAPKEVVTSIHPDILANENAKREAYNHYLANKSEAPVITEKELVLRVPDNYKDISNAELLATITQNLEYGHTHYTAYLALDILSGRTKKPANVKLVSVKFADKVVTASAPVKTEAAQLPDIIVERERFKREAFKNYLAEKTTRTAEIEEPETKIVLRVPSNYAELNATELLYVLMNNVELAHTRESAYTAVDILSRAIAKPQNVTLQAVKLEAPHSPKAIQLSTVKQTPLSLHPLQKEAERPKRELYKEELADRARAAFNAKPVIEEVKPLKVILLPEGYESMTPGELHFALVRNPELGHSQESARYTVDILEGKIKNAPVQFSVVILENPELAPVTAPRAIKPKAFNTEKKSSIIINRPSLLTRAQVPVTNSPEEGQRVLKIPHNYEEMSETQLHFALSHNKEYGHSYESTYETLDILYGRVPCPTSTVFATVEVDSPLERAY